MPRAKPAAHSHGPRLPLRLGAAALCSLIVAFGAGWRAPIAHAAGRSHLAHHHPRIDAKGSATSNSVAESSNWSGYDIAGSAGSYKSIGGCWIVPPALSSASGDTYSSAWVGIDGGSQTDAGDVIQVGTEQDWYQGSPYYSAWWETYPDPATPSSLTIQAGDDVCATVSTSGSSSWVLGLQDLTSGLSFSQTVTVSFATPEATAEWIVERPGICSNPSCSSTTLSELTNYDQVTFTQTTLNGSNPGLVAGDEVAMLNDAQTQVISTPSNPGLALDSFSVAYAAAQPLPPSSLQASSVQQYQLSGSDATWRPVDPVTLSSTFTPTSTAVAITTANADLWTSTAGYNQDIGIEVTPQGGAAELVAWKESGGFAGTFSPNAATVQGTYPVISGTTYTVALVWKANRPMPSGDSIWIGAGGNGAFSPTTMTTLLYTSSAIQTTMSEQQYQLHGSDGAAWQAVDSTNLSFTAGASATYVVTANADLWTSTAGYNQDIGIEVVHKGSATLVAWKESGGFAGTFSPNAAFVQARVTLSAGDTVTLVWKSNRAMPASDSIWIAAGSQGGYSPTTLFGVSYASAATPAAAVSTQQYSMSGSDGVTWTQVDPHTLTVTLTPSAAAQARIAGSADLWTSAAGYNQDLGIEVTGGGLSPVVMWKESGGNGGTYSPNAASVQAVYPLQAGIPYTISLVWKANRKMPAGDTIWVGAGPSAGSFSPTSLIVNLE